MYLYKYVTSERMDILKNCKVRFTQPAFLNDPFELSPTLQEFLDSETFDQIVEKVRKLASTDEEESMEIYQELSVYQPIFFHFGINIKQSFPFQKVRELNYSKEVVRDFLTRAMEYVRHNYNQLRDQIQTGFGMLSLSEKNDSLLMWAHYACSHSGFVLEIKSDHRALDQSQAYSGFIGSPQKVVYTNERPVIQVYKPKVNSKLALLQMVRNFFLTKSEEWSYEKEWRIILPVNQQIHLISFPPDCITSIILGSRISAAHRQQIKDLLNSSSYLSHIKIKQAIIDPQKFQVNIIDSE